MDDHGNFIKPGTTSKFVSAIMPGIEFIILLLVLSYWVHPAIPFILGPLFIVALLIARGLEKTAWRRGKPR